MGLYVSPLVTPDGRDMSDHLIPRINRIDFKAFVGVGIFLQKGADPQKGSGLGWDGGGREWRAGFGSLEVVKVDSIVTGLGRASSGMDFSRKKELPRGLRTGTHSGDRELLGWAWC